MKSKKSNARKRVIIKKYNYNLTKEDLLYRIIKIESEKFIVR